MSEGTDRDAVIRELAKKHVVYELPGMHALRVQRGLTYRAASGNDLLMDLYLPRGAGDRRPPAVLLPMAHPDPASRVRAYGPLTSWARLIASSGLAAIVYGAEAPAEDVHALLGHIRATPGALGLDANRLGLFASSANVTVALSALMRDRQMACAALLYGYTMDRPGSTAVADAGRQFGFGNACAGMSPDDLPAGVPLLFVRAGLDGFPGLNEALDAVVTRAVARNLPVWLVNHATGAHGFDIDEPSPLSRGIVAQVLAFLQLHLASIRQREPRH